MDPSGSAFDLTLAYPQWQGSGRHANLPRGAEAAAAVCGRYAPVLTVPLSDEDGDAHGVRRWAPIFDQFRQAREMLARSGARRVLTAGGDCAVDIAVIDYLRGIHPDLTIVWIDAHLDANTPDTSPSGNLHGMPVSAIMGHAPDEMRRLMGSAHDPARFRYCGIRVGDNGDWAFQREHGLRRLEADERLAGPVHIHFDLDVLEPSQFPHLAYPEPGGLAIDDAVALVGRIARDGDVVGLTITEFAPADADAARDGGKVIAQLCDAVVRR